MSSEVVFTPEATPSAPSGSNVSIFSDTNDNNRVKAQKANGEVAVLTENNRYNYLMNGEGAFIQRWPTALTTNTQTTPGNRYLMHDQWALTAQTASCQVARIDTIAAVETGITARFYMQLKQVSGAGKIMYTQTLEGKDTAALRGKTVRFQFKYKTGAWGSASALRMGVFQNNSSATVDTVATTFVSAFGANSVDPTLGSNLAYISPLTTGLDGVTTSGAAGTTAGQIANPGASSAWTRASALFTMPTNCVNIIVAVWTDSQISINDVLNLTEAGLYLGQEINDWNPLSHEDEYIRVARFYQKSFLVDTAPVAATGLGTGESSAPLTIAGANSNVMPRINFSPRMRSSAPAITFFNPATSSNSNARDVTHSADATATAAVNNTDTGFHWTCTPTAAGTVGTDERVHWTAEAAI